MRKSRMLYNPKGCVECGGNREPQYKYFCGSCYRKALKEALENDDNEKNTRSNNQ